METEIDLRPYVALLLRRWYVVALTGLVCGLIALGFSYMVSPTYEATAVVAVTSPRQLLTFDPRIESLADTDQPFAAYPDLAQSDELVQALLNQTDDGVLPDTIRTVQELQQLLNARSSVDPSVLRLQVRFEDAASAADIANRWAVLFVDWINTIYGNQGEGQVEFYEMRRQEAESALEQAESALIEYQVDNVGAVLARQLDSLEQQQSELLSLQRTAATQRVAAAALRDTFVGAPPGDPASVGDQLIVLLLQFESLTGQTQSGPMVELDVTGLAESLTASELLQRLDEFLATLEANAEKAQDQLDLLTPVLLNVQTELAAAEIEQERLERDVELAEETLLALARKVEEERILAQDTSAGAQLASSAVAPSEPASPQTSLYAIVGGVLGGIVGVVIVYGWAWWRLPVENHSTQAPSISAVDG